MALFSVDGVEWPFPCTIERVSEIRASSISGLMLDGSYFNDVQGQYLKYSVAIAVPRGQEVTYNALYEVLTSPVNEHSFVFPYNSGTVAFDGRVESVSDRFVYNGFGKTQQWRQIKFDAVANKPKRKSALLSATSTTGEFSDGGTTGETGEFSDGGNTGTTGNTGETGNTGGTGGDDVTWTTGDTGDDVTWNTGDTGDTGGNDVTWTTGETP